MEVQFFAPFGVIEANGNVVQIVTSQTRMQLLQQVVLLVRPQRRSLFVKTLLTHTWQKIVASLVHCHAPTAVFALLQGVVDILLESEYLCKREGIQMGLHWVAPCLNGFQLVHASGGDKNLHIRKSLPGDRNLFIQC